MKHLRTDLPDAQESVLGRVSQQLASMEKRDWELWLIFGASSIVIGLGLLAVLFPAAFLNQANIRTELAVSKELFISLTALLLVLNTYIVSRRVELRRVRSHLISATLQSELIRLQSFTDPLTEIYNRRSLDDMAGRYISRARRTREALAFMLIDVDHFKDVNTHFGHLTGDFVLAEIAALLKSSVRGSDAVVRYGGDEFLIMLAGATQASSAAVVKRLHVHVRDWNAAGQLQGFELSLSIGIAEWYDGQTLDEVLDVADRNMYSEKSSKGGVPAPVTVLPTVAHGGTTVQAATVVPGG